MYKTGVLEQDFVGKVTDKTDPTERLTEQEKALMALKQAEMLLSNYDPSKGAIIIRGRETDAAQANRVCAALLVLKGDQTITITSYVIGCDVPKPGLFGNRWDEKAFIKAHLPTKVISEGLLQGKKEEFTSFQNAKIIARNLKEGDEKEVPMTPRKP